MLRFPVLRGERCSCISVHAHESGNKLTWQGRQIYIFNISNSSYKFCKMLQVTFWEYSALGVCEYSLVIFLACLFFSLKINCMFLLISNSVAERNAKQEISRKRLVRGCFESLTQTLQWIPLQWGANADVIKFPDNVLLIQWADCWCVVIARQTVNNKLIHKKQMHS